MGWASEFAGRFGQLLVQVLHLPRPVGSLRQVNERAVENQDLEQGGHHLPWSAKRIPGFTRRGAAGISTGPATLFIEELARPITRRYFDAVREKGAADLTTELFEPISVCIVGTVIGLGDVATLARWFHALNGGLQNVADDPEA